MENFCSTGSIIPNHTKQILNKKHHCFWMFWPISFPLAMKMNQVRSPLEKSTSTPPLNSREAGGGHQAKPTHNLLRGGTLGLSMWVFATSHLQMITFHLACHLCHLVPGRCKACIERSLSEGRRHRHRTLLQRDLRVEGCNQSNNYFVGLESFFYQLFLKYLNTQSLEDNGKTSKDKDDQGSKEHGYNIT